MNEDAHPNLEQFLDYVKQNRGFDFTDYKRSSLGRRIEKRMQALNIARYADYQGYLQIHPGEFTLLFNAILINVTEFFRDPPAWDYLGAEVIPRILEGKPARQPIRVWSAGCASGEEAYSVAMLFGEALGKEGLLDRVKVYATDIDEEALALARAGRYSVRAVENVSRPLLEKYFVRNGESWEFRGEIRRAVIFGRHDLLQDPPISRVDLLLCRNTLMYFNTDSQRRVLARFHFALNDMGYLIVGRAEMLFTHADLFTPVDLKRRLFTKVHQTAFQERILLAQAGDTPAKETDDPARIMTGSAFDLGPAPQLVLDDQGNLVMANEQARTLLRLAAADRTRHFRDLDLPQEMLRIIDQTYTDSLTARLKSVQTTEIQWNTASGDPAYYQITLRSIRDAVGTVVGMSLVLEDTTSYRDFQEQLQRSRQELETVTDELQSSNEELETTNEELQSTVEELETTNEELQSTNEELETMNQELQSTNEELHTMNDELQTRSEELNVANSFLAEVLAGIREGLVVIDRSAQITAWNAAAEDLWGLRADEVAGRPFFSLDIGLPVDTLATAVSSGLMGEHNSLTVQAVNRRGKPILCAVQVSPLRSPKGQIGGVVLMMQAQEAPA
jgi:two-component system, chemotaxis family, CheB/CheR fusion protein